MDFYDRLRDYYLRVAEVLRGEADAASIFPNPTDKGMSRERTYAEFLRQHAPSKCNVFFGGYLFQLDGKESKQLDVIITTDTTPRNDFFNQDDSGKSFSPVEGTLGVVSIKSTLDKSALIDCLHGLASIPATEDLGKRCNPLLQIKNYDDWPFKIIYATEGVKADTALSHINDFYASNPKVPIGRRPNVIHVAGQYAIFKGRPGMCVGNVNETPHAVVTGDYYAFWYNADLIAISWVLDGLQKNAISSTHILFTYGDIINRVTGSNLALSPDDL